MSSSVEEKVMRRPYTKHVWSYTVKQPCIHSIVKGQSTYISSLVFVGIMHIVCQGPLYLVFTGISQTIKGPCTYTSLVFVGIMHIVCQWDPPTCVYRLLTFHILSRGHVLATSLVIVAIPHTCFKFRTNVHRVLFFVPRNQMIFFPVLFLHP
mgnify:CR=1 FL=1